MITRIKRSDCGRLRICDDFLEKLRLKRMTPEERKEYEQEQHNKRQQKKWIEGKKQKVLSRNIRKNRKKHRDIYCIY